MATSIEQARRDVQSGVERAQAWAESSDKRSFLEFERELWTLLLVLGRALVVVYLVRAALRPRAAEYRFAGERYVLAKNRRTTELGTRFGKVSFTRPVGRKIRDARAACDLPVDRDIGLCAGFSLGVVVSMTRLCAQMAFASARQTFAQFCEWMPSPRAVLRMVDAVGAEARSFLEQAPAPTDDGETLVIQADGKGAPTICRRERARRARPRRASNSKNGRHERRLRRREHPRVRRKPGKKSKNAKVAAVGVLYTLRHTDEGLEGPVNKRAYATFTSYRALFTWLHAEAVKRGYGTGKFVRVLFLADGADTLWDLQQEFFPDAEACLDWYHVVEKIWAAGKCLHRDDSPELEAWVTEQKLRLRRGSFDAMMTELTVILEQTPLTGPGNKYRRTVLAKTIAHFEKHRLRMRYQRLRRLDLDIATGIVEGAVRHIVGIRLDGPGMRWGLDRLERVLHLRCILVNGMWDDFVDHLAGRQLCLAAQPMPARTHDAKPVKQAA
jgi:hypothetical protein